MIELERNQYTLEKGQYKPGYIFKRAMQLGIRHKRIDYLVDLKVGSDDKIHILRPEDLDSNFYYVLSLNPFLPYVGLEVYALYNDICENMGEVFFQEHQVENNLGTNWKDLTPVELAQKLDEYCY